MLDTPRECRGANLDQNDHITFHLRIFWPTSLLLFGDGLLAAVTRHMNKATDDRLITAVNREWAMLPVAIPGRLHFTILHASLRRGEIKKLVQERQDGASHARHTRAERIHVGLSRPWTRKSGGDRLQGPWRPVVPCWTAGQRDRGTEHVDEPQRREVYGYFLRTMSALPPPGGVPVETHPDGGRCGEAQLVPIAGQARHFQASHIN